MLPCPRQGQDAASKAIFSTRPTRVRSQRKALTAELKSLAYENYLWTQGASLALHNHRGLGRKGDGKCSTCLYILHGRLLL